jgi:hypothetical protein
MKQLKIAVTDRFMDLIILAKISTCRAAGYKSMPKLLAIVS